MKDCLALIVKRLVAFPPRLMPGDHEPMSSWISRAVRCKGPQAESKHAARGASWLAAIGLVAVLPVAAGTSLPVVPGVPYEADPGSVVAQCGRLIDMHTHLTDSGRETSGDLIAVKGDPLADITRLQDVAVIKGGLAFKLSAE